MSEEKGISINKKKNNSPNSICRKGNWGGIQCIGAVIDIYDGDTITVQVNLKHLYMKYSPPECKKYFNELPYAPFNIKVRMSGYNCAEMRPPKKNPDGTSISDELRENIKEKAKESKRFLSDLILNKDVWCHFLDFGEGVLIQKKIDDPYGREVADIYTLDEDGKKNTYVNVKMLEKGYAKEYNGTGEKKY